MSTAEVAKKSVEEAPVKEAKKDPVVQKKLYSIVLVWIAFVILYFAVSSGNETFMWAALGLMAITSGFLYLKN